MLHILGYFAAGLNLLGMAMKNVTALRFLSMVANAMYVIYGFQLGSIPIIVSCAIATLIHLYHLGRILIARKKQ